MIRNYLMFFIPSQVMIDIFSGEGLRVIKTDLPENANFIDAHYDMQRRGFLAVYEHESFPNVPEGNVIPMADIQAYVEHIEDGDES